MFGFGFGINKNRYYGTGSGPVPPTSPTFYVDSVTGDDGNDGISEGTAFATMGAVPLEDGMVINIARGSVFKEQFRADTYNDIVVNAYGTGKMPIFDGSEVAPSSWVIDGEFTNVYNQDMSYVSDFGHYLGMWEDGERLMWVDSMEECDETPGSWTIDGEDDGLTPTVNGTVTFSIHPYGSTDPTSDGKVYEYTAREYCVFTGENWVLNDIHGRRQINNNGSVILGRGGIANGCIAEDGVKHNFFLEGDTVANDCIVWKSDFPNRIQMGGFVAFETDAAARSAVFNRCIALFEDDKMEMALDNGSAIAGIMAHSDGVEGHNWMLIETNDCSFQGTTIGFGMVDTDQHINRRCFVDGGEEGMNLGAFINTIIDPYIRQRDDVTMNRAITISQNATTTLNGARIYRTRGGDADVYVPSSEGSVEIANSVFYRDSGVNNHIMLRVQNDEVPMNIHHNIFFMNRGGGNDTYSFNLPGGFDGLINNNVHASAPLTEAKVEIGGTEYWYEDYIVVFPQFDSNSSEADPLLIDPANGDFNVDDGSSATPLGAGLLRPDIVYTPIPTHNEVDDM